MQDSRGLRFLSVMILNDEEQQKSNTYQERVGLKISMIGSVLP